MEPSGLDWYRLYERLKRCGFGVCLVNCLAVKNNRRTMSDGTSIKKRPRVTHIGSAYLRHWLYHYALRLVAHEPHFKKLYRRRMKNSPGKGSGLRGLVSVSDKILRIVYRVPAEKQRYTPSTDILVAAYYKQHKKAA